MKPKDYSISILMPTYNNVCVGLVEMLHAQCERIARRDATGLVYEIVVADDGSTDSRTVTENRAINALDHCRFIERKTNSGRSAIRNFLAKESCGEWLLFIDSDVVIDCDDFIGRYLDSNATAVVCGGISPGQYPDILHLNLRYKYEWAEAHRHTAEARSKAEHKCFRTTNFMVRRDIMLDNPFDEAITAYGYEDVVFGKRLCEKGIGVVHIDNPVVLADYEDNLRFVAKTEESLRTLFQLKDRLSLFQHIGFHRQNSPDRVAWHTIGAGKYTVGEAKYAIWTDNRPACMAQTGWKAGTEEPYRKTSKPVGVQNIQDRLLHIT